MRAIVQRVSSASVTEVDSEMISSIGRGLMVLVGIGRDDTTSDLETLTKQILTLKVFSDETSGASWKKSVKDIDGEVLCVSQFTLFATTPKGKPDFHRAMASGPSRDLYGSFLKRMGELYKPEKIKDGRFGAMMDVRLTNEGPVTFTLDSRKFEYVDPPPASASKKTPAAQVKQTARAEAMTAPEPKGVALAATSEE
ncbi:D-Tyr tRNAtyr deacylase-like domain-containing protein [Trametes elegans]|nr:D-Tyr tRNAtyr deacylase-like domain-containing protein [Trametes elegans]